eukprot:6795692-Prymnesium_polylepis.1
MCRHLVRAARVGWHVQAPCAAVRACVGLSPSHDGQRWQGVGAGVGQRLSAARPVSLHTEPADGAQRPCPHLAAAAAAAVTLRSEAFPANSALHAGRHAKAPQYRWAGGYCPPLIRHSL